MRKLSHDPLLKRKMAVAAGCALLAGSLAPAVLADASPAVSIDSIRVEGDRIRVALKNRDEKAAGGELSLRALTEAGIEEASLAFVVPGGQTVLIVFDMSSPVSEVIELGAVVDDGSPF